MYNVNFGAETQVPGLNNYKQEAPAQAYKIVIPQTTQDSFQKTTPQSAQTTVAAAPQYPVLVQQSPTSNQSGDIQAPRIYQPQATQPQQRPSIYFPMVQHKEHHKFDWDNFYRIAGLATSVILTILIAISLKPLLGGMGKKPKPISMFTSYKDDPNIIPLSKLPGMQEVKDEFQRKIINPIKYKELFAYFGVEPQMSCMLYGPPGTGKTNFVYSAAKEVGALVADFKISSEGTALLHETSGNLQRKAKAIIEEADKNPNQPYFVLFDEINGLLTESKHFSSEHKTEEVTTMLDIINQLKTRKNISIFGTTNEIYNPVNKTAGDMNQAAVDRFNSYIFVGNPDHNARKNALKLYMKKHPKLTAALIRDNEALEELARLTEGCSYRELKEKVYDKAVEEAMDMGTRATNAGKNYENIKLTFDTFKNIIETYVIKPRQLDIKS